MVCRNQLHTLDAFRGGGEVEVSLMARELHSSQAPRGMLHVQSQLQWGGQPGLATSSTSKL